MDVYSTAVDDRVVGLLARLGVLSATRLAAASPQRRAAIAGQAVRTLVMQGLVLAQVVRTAMDGRNVRDAGFALPDAWCEQVGNTFDAGPLGAAVAETLPRARQEVAVIRPLGQACCSWRV